MPETKQLSPKGGGPHTSKKPPPTKAKSKRRPAALPPKDNESQLSSSLLRKIAVDSDKGKGKGGKRVGDGLGISDSDDDLGEIREARMASRKAIDMLMQGIKNRRQMPVWVPTGEQEKIFHSNARPSPATRRKAKLSRI